MSQATSTQSGEKALAPVAGGPLDGWTIANPHGYIIAGWSCSRALKNFEIKYRMPDDKNRRTEADDANYRCRTINPSLADNCQRCGARFDVDVEALDKEGRVIATVKMITERDDHYWRYSEDYSGYKPNLTWNHHSTDWCRYEKMKQRR